MDRTTKDQRLEVLTMEKRKDIEKKFWDSYAGKYDSFIHKNAQKEYRNVFQLLKEDCKNSQSILEVATGTGLLSFEIYDDRKQMYACDISPEMIKIAKQKAIRQQKTKVKFDLEDINELNYTSGKFETVIASNVLHLLTEPGLAITELKRVLKEEGKLILPTYLHGDNLLSYSVSKIMGLSGFKARSRWSQKSFERYLKLHKLQIIRSRKIKSIIPLYYVVCERVN